MLGDGRRESPLESWSAWAFDESGVVRPDWQVEIHDIAGIFVGRSDCWWPSVAGEADGRSKYALAAAERIGATTVYEVLQAERRREQRLRDAGAEVIRWSAADVLNPQLRPVLAARTPPHS